MAVIKNRRTKTRVKNTMQDIKVPDGSISIEDYLNIGSNSAYTAHATSSTGTVELPLDRTYTYGKGFKAVIELHGIEGPDYGARMIFEKISGSSTLLKVTTIYQYGDSYLTSVNYTTDMVNPGTAATKIVISGLPLYAMAANIYMD